MSDEQTPKPESLLRDGIRAVPAVRYAQGVVGIVAAIVLIGGMGVAPRAAILGTLAMLALMTLLLLFETLAKRGGAQLRIAAHVLMWVVVGLTLVLAVTLLFSLLFEFPRPLGKLFG